MAINSPSVCLDIKRFLFNMPVMVENFCGSGSSESDAFGSHALSLGGGGSGLGGADLGGVLGGDSSLSAGVVSCPCLG